LSKGDTDILTVLMLTGVLSERRNICRWKVLFVLCRSWRTTECWKKWPFVVYGSYWTKAMNMALVTITLPCSLYFSYIICRWPSWPEHV